MKIDTVITVEEWDELGKEMYPRNTVFLVHAVCAVCLAFAARCYTTGEIKMMIYYILLGIVLEFITMFARSRRLKSNRDFFRQVYQDQNLVLTTTFNEDNFEIENQLAKDKSTFEYSSLTRLYETKKNLMVMGRGNQFFIFNKEEAAKLGIKEFLLSKNEEIKQGKQKFLGIL